MSPWFDQLQQARQSGDGSAVIVTVARVRGSAPREVGARMIVARDKAFGTIGGGQLEHQCLAIARKYLKTGAADVRELRNFPLGTNCGQCCGGVVDILFETVGSETPGWLTYLAQAKQQQLAVVAATPLDGAHTPDKYFYTATDQADTALARQCRKLLDGSTTASYVKIKQADGPRTYLLEAFTRAKQRIVIYGAGHVGAALVEVLAKLDCQLQWVDSRADLLAAASPPNVEKHCLANPLEHADQVSEGSQCLVMTHSHALDFDLCAKLLAREDLAYCGLIGSASKRRRFERLCRQAGLPEEFLERLTCPIGIDGIAGKSPAEIAISVAAQLLSLDTSSCAQRSDIKTKEPTHAALPH